MTTTIVDYSEDMIKSNAYGSFNLIKAQGKAHNVLILSKLEEPLKRIDGKMARYQLEHRFLSQDCENSKDQAYVCVQSSDFTYWQRKEIKDILKSLDDCVLFDHFNLF